MALDGDDAGMKLDLDHCGILSKVGFDQRVVGEHLVEVLANKGDRGTTFKSIKGARNVFG